MPRIRLSGSYANFSGTILGVGFEDGVGDVPSNVANLISAAIGPIMEIDEDGDDVGVINFDPRASMILPEIVPTPHTQSVFPVDVTALAAAIADLTERLETLEDADLVTKVADLEDRVVVLEGAGV